MAEPEELEDDLFADLYDADESTNRATSAVEAPQPTNPTPSAVPVQPVEESVVPSYNPSATDTYPTHTAPQPEYGTGFQNGSEYTPAHHAVTTPADNEQSGSGTGIKEDG
ncbi:RNA-binding protein [Penicillium canariense]|uniref:RNA-binding protein n=1 Tax=Penicillium canariense TaxID=189055 RepID=A0A9W9HJE9_9EURO|nr:RNA-binding protein [Penicillium canariense]KAJ5150948.1 RNA-binding protein [Penicillium canariense]